MSATQSLKAADLFAGLGGFSLGAEQAGCEVVWAANHWPAAVGIHSLNHPATVHACQDLHQTDWASVPAMDLLMASPACQGHSRARGREQAHHDAQRSTAWAVVSAAEYHRPAFLLIENVPEFYQWTLYGAWAMALGQLGYALAPMILDAADHGVPQHRRRLFIVGTRSRSPVQLDLPKRPYVPASQIIDFNAGSWNPIDTPRRSKATLARIRAGRKAHGQRFLAPYYGGGSGLTGRSLSRPIGTITTRDRWAVIDGDRMRMASVEECQLGMGFPDSYRLPARQKDAMHMLGNAVVPVVARDLITALREAA